MNKLTVAVIFGGVSSEHEVSLQSAQAVIEALDRERFEVVSVGITREGAWLRYRGEPSKIADGSWERGDCVPAFISPERTSRGLIELGAQSMRITRLDAAFPVLHGKNGEDGTVQGLIELAGIPLVGCGTLAAALCMDKNRAHILAAAAGVRVPRAMVISRRERSMLAKDFARETGLPLFVKPVKAGSSFGISKVSDPGELDGAIELAFRYDNEVIIEEGIEGFEVGCAVMGGDELFVGEVDEIELSDGFFDFTEKYNLISSAIHVPARISGEKALEIKEEARLIYRALGCSGLARVDMFLTPGGEIVFNEVNTIPGFTAHSRFPSMMKAAGLPFEQMLTRIIETAVIE